MTIGVAQVSRLPRTKGFPSRALSRRLPRMLRDTLRAVTVPAAAAELGVSVDTVKRRLADGRLAGKKAGGKWTVYLEGNESAPEPEKVSPETFFGEAGRLALELEAERRINAALMARVEAQEAQLSAGIEERAELRRLLAGALQSRAIPAMSAAELPQAVADSATTAAQMSRKPAWWPFGRRTPIPTR